MASIPTNAFSAPRVRWVMQQKMRDEQQKKQDRNVDGGNKMEELEKSENNTFDQNRFNDAMSQADRFGEPTFRPIFQRMQSATIMDSFRRYMPATFPRPDFGRSLSCNESTTRDRHDSVNSAEDAQAGGGGDRTKTRFRSAIQ